MNIGRIHVDSRLVLAPMAGVTDLAFRQICRELGAGLTVTEMVSAKALCYQDRKTRSLLRLGPGEHPAGVQIFGSDAACMAEAACMAAELSGADFIDINMGCPVGKVVSNGDGSALMKDPEKAARIAEAVVKACPVPVTVKMRRGWDKGSINAVELARMLEQVGVSAVAVHGRTRTQMYAGQADWVTIRQVKQADEHAGGYGAHHRRYQEGPEMTEQQWIARARHGDADAFEQLVVAYEGPVYRLALRMCGSTEDAREVTQDAFLAAWRGLPAFRGDSRFSSWLYRLTTNAAIDFLRREKHHLGNLPLEEAPERPDPQQPELLAEQREQQEALQRALDQLSSEHRQVLLLRVVQQLSYDEIAQALSLESGTVKSRISRARRQLREILLRQGNFFPDSAVLPNGKEG